MTTEIDIAITEHEGERRFSTTVDGHEAYLSFSEDGSRIILLHTFVPPELEGRGIAGRLATHGLGYAREHGMKVVPECPYVRSYIERHPEYQELVE